MKKSRITSILFSTLTAIGFAGSVSAMTLTSQDLKEGHHMAKTFEFNGWGCEGSNLSPQLAWTDVPAGTKSFAITAYDPDAPTGSGFWHWQVVNIPAKTTAIAQGADLSKLGATVIENDYGNQAFGGACPPVGDGMHRYQFTVWALPVEKLELSAETPAAIVGFTLNAQALDKAVITATYSK